MLILQHCGHRGIAFSCVRQRDRPLRMAPCSLPLVVAVLAVLAVVPPHVHACGISTHIEVGHRAIEYFDSNAHPDYYALLNKHQDAFQAGNPFPDAMFAPCGANGADAESTHWTPFMRAAAEYIHETYPRPWDEATEKLVVFLLGLVSHQVADINWHSLGIDQGLLTSMGGTNFHGDGLGRAQALGDRLDDAMVQFDLQMGYDQTVGHWYIPLKDLVPIYRKMDAKSDVTDYTLLKCTTVLFLGRFGEKLALSNAYEDTSDGTLAGFEGWRSPFLSDNFYTYFFGGVDDMAQWTANIWDAVVRIVEHGSDGCDLPTNPLFVRCNDTQSPASRVPPSSARPLPKAEEIRRHYEIRQKITEPFADKLASLVKVEPHLRGVRLSLDMAGFADLLRSEAKSKRAPAEGIDPSVPVRPLDAPSLGTYARLGAGVAAGDFNDDGVPDLAVGAPGSGQPGDTHVGSVIVTLSPSGYAPRSPMSLDVAASLSLEGDMPFSRFGESVCACDLNGDGIDDLAVGAPSAFSETISYRGALYVYYGRRDATPVFDKPDLTIIGEGPDLVLSDISNFGLRLSAGDIDADGHADLIVSSPYANYNGRSQSGAVWVLLSSSHARRQSLGSTMNVSAATDFVLEGPAKYGWFGYNTEVVVPKGGASRYLFVAEPYARDCRREDCDFDEGDVQGIGALHIFDFTGCAAGAAFVPKRVAWVVGTEEFETYGSSFAVGDFAADGRTLVAVSSPRKTVNGKLLFGAAKWVQAGEVNIYPLEMLLASTNGTTSAALSPYATLQGDRIGARFGERLVAARVSAGDALFVSAPQRTEDPAGMDASGRDEGMLYMYEALAGGNPTLTRCELTTLSRPCPDDASAASFRPFQASSRFAYSFVVADFDGSGQMSVAVGAPFSPSRERVGGAVYLLPL